MAEHRWSDYEKIYLLAEIIKAGNPHFGTLLQVINQHQSMQNPDWNHVIIPPGRTVAQCKDIFNQYTGRPPLPQPPMTYSPFPPQTPLSPSAGASGPGGLKRSFDSTVPAFPSNRPLQPRPQAGGGATYSQAPQPERPPKKKRGRPTKAEAQAKAERQGSAGAAAPRSEPFVTSVRLPITAATAPALPQPVEVRTTIYPNLSGSAFAEPASRPYVPPTPRVPITINSLVTPSGPGSGSQSSSSSGKRRRGPSTRSNPDNQPEAEADREAAMTLSPSERFVPREPEDTPARAAITRHRDEQETSPQEQQQQRDPEGYGVRLEFSPRTQGPGRT